MPRRPMASRYAAENRNNVQIGVARILNLSRYVAAVINGYPTTMTCHGHRGHCRGMPWHVTRRVVGSHGMSWDSPWHATACPGMSWYWPRPSTRSDAYHGKTVSFPIPAAIIGDMPDVPAYPREVPRHAATCRDIPRDTATRLSARLAALRKTSRYVTARRRTSCGTCRGGTCMIAVDDRSKTTYIIFTGGFQGQRDAAACRRVPWHVPWSVSWNTTASLVPHPAASHEESGGIPRKKFHREQRRDLSRPIAPCRDCRGNHRGLSRHVVGATTVCRGMSWRAAVSTVGCRERPRNAMRCATASHDICRGIRLAVQPSSVKRKS